ncbi:MAG: MBL fold metallo-hydrolase [Anaerolineales bacterium]
MVASSIFIEPFVDTRLGNSAYLVGSHASQRAVLIDPLRDVDQYRAAAERLGVQITYVLDTHLHNDFVSGARELAAQTGAVIGVSAADPVGFEHKPLVENDEIETGDLRIRVLTTPGHTPEHISFLIAEGGKPSAIFSGGALMVGGAARTDLLGHEHTVPLARQSFHTVHDKLLTLGDEVAVYPTHGAGTFCAAPVSSERTTTIGRERRGNYLALAQSEDEFVQLALSGLPSYPVYYPHVRAMNRRGPRVLGGVPMLKSLSAEEVQAFVEIGVAVLDVRPARRFAEGHIPGAYGIQVSAPLSTWAGWLIPFGTPLVLVADAITDRVEAVRQLIRIGYDDLRGYLHEGMEAWAKAGLPVETVPTISARELRERLNAGDALTVLDVRQQNEWDAGHIPGALHVENGRLATDTPALPADRPIAVHCARGARSMAGISVLLRKGYRNLIQVEDGITAWQAAGGDVMREA